MRRQLSVIAALGLLACLAPVSAQAPLRSVSGSITYRERIALPPGAVAEITVVDVSRADAAGTVIGRQRIEDPGQVPIPFTVDFEPSAVDPRHRYAVRATISNGTEAMFTSTTRCSFTCRDTSTFMTSCTGKCFGIWMQPEPR